MRNPVTITCAECGVGHYPVSQEMESTATCTQCGHTIDPLRDVYPYLEEGEVLVSNRSGLLAYLPAND